MWGRTGQKAKVSSRVLHRRTVGDGNIGDTIRSYDPRIVGRDAVLKRWPCGFKANEGIYQVGSCVCYQEAYGPTLGVGYDRGWPDDV